jgi:lysozyme
MNISSTGLDLIEICEGLRTETYPDADGHPTIGFGHMLKPGESFPNGITAEQATELLRGDVAFAEHAVNCLVTPKLTQGQFDALVSFTYNEGAGRLQSSTLLKVLNAGDYAAVPAQLMEWVYGGGVKLPGLVTRRAAEAAMFVGA